MAGRGLAAFMGGHKTTRNETISNLCTGHLSLEVSEILDEKNNADWFETLTVASTKFGWFVRVPDKADPNTPPSEMVEYPSCLSGCFEVARDNEANWIHFDRDEEPIAGLPTFDW